MIKDKLTTRFMTQAALIAAAYAALTLALAPFSFGMLQFRLSEALTVLPLFTPAAVPGLFVGCALANLGGVMLGQSLPPDILIGSLATLIAALMTRRLRGNVLLALIPPVAVNALVIGVELGLLGVGPVWACIGYVGLGQLGVCYTAGLLLYAGLRRVPERMWAIR